MPTALVTQLRTTERRRLRCLVDARVDEADGLHAADFQLVHPSGGVWTKEQYLGGSARALECWHLDCYRRDGADGRWQVRWSQATSIDGS